MKGYSLIHILHKKQRTNHHILGHKVLSSGGASLAQPCELINFVVLHELPLVIEFLETMNAGNAFFSLIFFSCAQLGSPHLLMQASWKPIYMITINYLLDVTPQLPLHQRCIIWFISLAKSYG